MRVGIYNRWLATLGGGEKYNLTIAEYLSQRHAVQVISHKPTPKEHAEGRLGLDLSRVEFITTPECQPIEVSALTGEYDLFINASHLDYFPSSAKYSANVVYFPARLGRFTAAYRKLKLLARQRFALPAVMTGIQAFEPTPTSFKWIADAQLRIRLPASPSAYRFALDVAILDERVTRVSFILDDAILETLPLSSPCSRLHYELSVPATGGSGFHEFALRCEPQPLPGDKPQFEVSGLWLSLPQFRLYQALFERWIKGIGLRLQYYPPGASMLDYLGTYTHIWSISKFTSKWIKRYWRRKSEVLYPPVNVEDFKAGEKKAQILNVGRFFAGNHNKKHLEMAQAFKGLVDQGLQGWELHLAGGRTPGKEHEQYLENVYQAASGYPIVIHPNISPGELLDLYAGSAIYWHASGYGEDERQDPDKYEHFGITTVEAMAAACVPLVIGKGGQPEIVAHGRSGYLWNNLGQLQALTMELSRDASKRQRMAQMAMQESQRYNKANFYARLQELLEQMGFESGRG